MCVAYTVCKGSAKSTQHLLHCEHCSESMHLSCHVKTFKDESNESMRNKIEWLHDFVKYFFLVYLCKACCEKYSVTSKFVDRTILDVG